MSIVKIEDIYIKLNIDFANFDYATRDSASRLIDQVAVNVFNILSWKYKNVVIENV